MGFIEATITEAACPEVSEHCGWKMDDRFSQSLLGTNVTPPVNVNLGYVHN